VHTPVESTTVQSYHLKRYHAVLLIHPFGTGPRFDRAHPCIQWTLPLMPLFDTGPPLRLHTAIGYGMLSMLFVGGVDGHWLQAGPDDYLCLVYRVPVSMTTLREMPVTSTSNEGEDRRFRMRAYSVHKQPP